MVGPQEGSLVYICTKLEVDSFILSKVIRGLKISHLGHMTSATPTYGSLYGAYTGTVRPLSLYQI